MYQKYFPTNTKSLEEVLQDGVALAFVNTHVSLSFPRLYVPNMVEVGGINIDRRHGVLEAEFKDFLDNATDGAVLFSMGSILQASHCSVEQLATLISGFGKLKNRVIWRYNLNDTDRLPKNILAKEWLPQKEILAHPNLKLFITHGGMLGTTESVYHGKPMIGIPVYGDQYRNIAVAVGQGYALQLDVDKLSEQALLNAVNEILGNPCYINKAEELSRIYRDQPMTPQESVLYWIEYVIRHKGAKHLRMENLNFFAYHGLDVLAILLVALVLLVLVLRYLMVKWVTRKVIRGKRKENVKSKKKET